jgi:uncharacterized protein
MDTVEGEVRLWLERVVIGLNLCPFAAMPYRNGHVRIIVVRPTTQRNLLAELWEELLRIDAAPVSELETTLVVVASLLVDFKAFNLFLDDANCVLRQGGWDGLYQFASFHPQYRFEGIEEHDASNLTNRSPWPILQIIRESSIDKALEDYPRHDSISESNIEKMESLSADKVVSLFPWLGRRDPNEFHGSFSPDDRRP